MRIYHTLSSDPTVDDPFGTLLPLTEGLTKGRSCPECMDRLLFASEDVRSEVADMYPAC